MAEYIEREALVDVLTVSHAHHANNSREASLLDRDIRLIWEQPAADVAPVVHGRWEFISDNYVNCTNCGTIFESRPTPYFFKMNNKFCRRRMCGARMDGE